MKLDFAVCVRYPKMSSICRVVAIIELCALTVRATLRLNDFSTICYFHPEIGFFFLSNRL